MVAIVVSILTILAALAPVIVDIIRKSQEKTDAETSALIQRDLDVLHAPPTDGGRVQ